jgi:hypothetical protein
VRLCVTDCGLGDRGLMFRLPAGSKDFSLLKASIQVLVSTSFPEDKVDMSSCDANGKVFYNLLSR